MLGQAKVCLKVDSEEEMMALAEKAAEKGLIHYVVVRRSADVDIRLRFVLTERTPLIVETG